MITEEEYQNYLGITPPSDFNVLLDIAISAFFEICPQFPVTAEELATFTEQQQEFIKKALFLQINHYDNNRELLNGVDSSSFSVGKYSETVSVKPFPQSARTMLDMAGICNLWVTTNKGGCDCCG